LPSIIIVALVSRFVIKFKNNSSFKNAFYGIRPAVTGILAVVGIELLSVAVIRTDMIPVHGILGSIDILKSVIFLIVFYLIVKFDKHPVLYILLSGLIGIILKL